MSGNDTPTQSNVPGSTVSEVDVSRYFRRNTVELRAAGFDPEDIAGRPLITIAAPHTNAHRCNNRVERIAELLVDAVAARGGQALIVGAPAVSDALTQGTPNAGYSLVSRDLIADAIELGHRAQHCLLYTSPSPRD